MIKTRKAAIELSIGTIVIIVLAMSMLILGLVLVQRIFSGATQSVDVLNDKVINAMSALFTDENSNVVVKLGPDQTVKVKPDSGDVNVPFGARTSDGSAVTRTRLKYKLTLEEANGKNCISPQILGLKKTQDLFKTPLDQLQNFDRPEGASAFSLIKVNVPKGTATCTQKVLVDVTDTQAQGDQYVGGNFFYVEILKGSLF
ncbi:hypothetical protein KW787_02250 [Candidatus Pacearchaeota archaeon]|nr:hypothetical protein [Candidatus Pacearchaeota archaeon]